MLWNSNMFKGGGAIHDTSDEYGAKNTADSHLDSFSHDFFDTKYHKPKENLVKRMPPVN